MASTTRKSPSAGFVWVVGAWEPPFCLRMTPSSRPTRSKASSARSRCCVLERGRHLHADARRALRHDGVAEAGHEDALVEQPLAEADRERGLPDDDRDDRRLAVQRPEPGLAQPRRGSAARASRSRSTSSGSRRSSAHGLSALQATVGGSAFEKSCGRERWARMSQTVRARGDEAAGRAAQRLAERAGDDVDLAEQAEVLGHAAARSRPSRRCRASRRRSRRRRARAPARRSRAGGARSPSMLKTPSVTISFRARRGARLEAARAARPSSACV